MQGLTNLPRRRTRRRQPLRRHTNSFLFLLYTNSSLNNRCLRRKRGQVDCIDIRRLRGDCTNAPIFDSVGYRVRGNRFIALLNPSNYNGSALLHYVTKLASISNNGVLLSNISVIPLDPRGHKVNVIFRDCTLFPGVAIRRGITFNLHVRGIGTSSDRQHITSILGLIRLGRFTTHCPRRLSNNRYRQITLTHSLIAQPHLLLLSRPLSTLSTQVHGRLHRRVHRVRHRLNLAAVFIARSRRRTLAVSSHVFLVGRKGVMRDNSTRALCATPISIFTTNFVNGCGLLSTSDTAGLLRQPVGDHVTVHPRTVRLDLGNRLSTRVHDRDLLNGIVHCQIRTQNIRLIISILGHSTTSLRPSNRHLTLSVSPATLYRMT